MRKKCGKCGENADRIPPVVWLEELKCVMVHAAQRKVSHAKDEIFKRL